MYLKSRLVHSVLVAVLFGSLTYIALCWSKHVYFTMKYQEQLAESKSYANTLSILETDRFNELKSRAKNPHAIIDDSNLVELNERIAELFKEQKELEKLKAYYHHARRYPWLY